MAATLTVPKAQAKITATLTGGQAPATGQWAVNHSVLNAPDVGSSAGQSNKVHSLNYLVSNGTPLTIDLTSTVDPSGAAIAFSFVNAILVSNDSVAAGQDLTVGGGSNPIVPASPAVQPNGGAYYVSAPNPGITVDSTHKILQITVAAGTNVPIQVTVLGR